jgi:hypothetical protein
MAPPRSKMAKKSKHAYLRTSWDQNTVRGVG